MAKQIPFDLPTRPALGRDAFFVAPSNAVALASIDGWQTWPGRKMVLTGPKGAGKTHLAHVWAAQSGARIVAAADLAGADIVALASGPVAVEDADAIAGDRDAEEALFHLHNLVLAEGHTLLLTAQTPPARWGLTLPDLTSRMQGTLLATLDQPDDQLLMAMLLKLFADRQLSPTPNALAYLLRHMDRSAAAAAELVARIDRRSLAEGRRITRGLAAEVLDNPDDL
jgi:chromosomal replication initiation ATPase DnaA